MLISTLGGYYVLVFARLLGCAPDVDKGGNEGTIAILYVVDSAVGLLQVSLQVIYIKDLYHRYEHTLPSERNATLGSAEFLTPR